MVTLISSAVGAGVLSFRYALRCTGWAAGLACIAGIAGVEAFTLYVLTKVAETTGASSYSALVSAGCVLKGCTGGACADGHGGQACGQPAWTGLLPCTLCLLAPARALKLVSPSPSWPGGSVLRFRVAYLIIIGDSFRPILLELFGHAWWINHAAVIAGIGCSVVLPACYRTRLGALQGELLRAQGGACVLWDGPPCEEGQPVEQQQQRTAGWRGDTPCQPRYIHCPAPRRPLLPCCCSCQLSVLLRAAGRDRHRGLA